ncbi:MAG: hypothetical protein H6553_08970 [Chitinophagales bacterium]|nr:hypothetical protein [Chitinophagales bacterium]
MKKGLLLVIILFTYSCINLLFSLDENPNRVRQNQKEYNPLLGSPYEKMFAYRQEEINKKTEIINLPQFGLSFNFISNPTIDTVKENNIYRLSYYKEIFGKEGLIGRYNVDVLPNAIQPNDSLVFDEIINSIKQDKNLPPIIEILNKQQIVYNGFYNLFIVKSKYTNSAKNLTVFRWDFLYRTWQGVTRFSFIQNSTETYLYESRINLIAMDNFKWYDYNVVDNNLKIEFTSPRGVFQYSSVPTTNSIAFRSFLPNYNSTIDIFKLNTQTTTLNEVANEHFSKILATNKTITLNDYLPKGTKNNYISKKYLTIINNNNYIVYEYVFKVNNDYFTATVKNNLDDVDGRGSPLFLKEVEKILDSIKPINNNQTDKKPSNNNNEDDIYDYFGY